MPTNIISNKVPLICISDYIKLTCFMWLAFGIHVPSPLNVLLLLCAGQVEAAAGAQGMVCLPWKACMTVLGGGGEKLRIKCHETTSEVNWCRIKRTELNESAGIMGVLHHWDILTMSLLCCHVSGNIVVITENILCTLSCWRPVFSFLSPHCMFLLMESLCCFKSSFGHIHMVSVSAVADPVSPCSCTVWWFILICICKV